MSNQSKIAMVPEQRPASSNDGAVHNANLHFNLCNLALNNATLTHEFISKQQCKSERTVCSTCYSLKKLVKLGRKLQILTKTSTYFFTNLHRLNPLNGNAIMRDAVSYYPKLNPQERQIVNKAFIACKKKISRTQTELWSGNRSDHHEPTWKTDSHQRCIDRIQIETNLYAQGAAFEHEDGPGFCSTPYKSTIYTICKYCITGEHVWYVRCRWGKAIDNALAGYIVNIMKTESTRFCESMLIELNSDPRTRKWLKTSLQRYSDQIPAPLLTNFMEMMHAQVGWPTFFTEGLSMRHEHDLNVNVVGLDNVIQSISSHFKDLLGENTATGLISRFTGFILLMAELCSSSNIATKIRSILLFVLQFDFSRLVVNIAATQYAQSLAKVFQRMREQIDNWREGDGEGQDPLVAQSGFDKECENVVTGTTRLFAAMIGDFVPGMSNMSIHEQSDRSKKLDMYARSVVSMEKLGTFIVKLIKYAYKTVIESYYGLPVGFSELVALEKNLGTWATEVSDYYNSGGLQRVTKNRTEAGRVREWKRQGDSYNNLLFNARTTSTVQIQSAFRLVYTMANSLFSAASHFMSESRLHVEPLVVYVYGESGIGKSVMQSVLIGDVMAHIDKITGRTGEDTFRMGRNTFVMNMNDDYVPGYKPMEHRAIQVDDAFQLRKEDTISKTVDFIIKSKNIVDFNMVMADLESKGNTKFDSEMVFFTSNIPPPINELAKVAHCPSAIVRRFDAIFEQRVKREFRDKFGHIDIAKVLAKYPHKFDEEGKPYLDTASFDVYEFTMFDESMNAKAGCGMMTFNDVVDHLRSTYQSKKTACEIVIRTIERRETERCKSAESTQPFVAQVGWSVWNDLTPPRVASPTFSEISDASYADLPDEGPSDHDLISVFGLEQFTMLANDVNVSRHSIVTTYHLMKGNNETLREALDSTNFDAIRRCRTLSIETKKNILDKFTEYFDIVRNSKILQIGVALVSIVATVWIIKKLFTSSTPMASESYSTDVTRVSKPTMRAHRDPKFVSVAETYNTDNTRQSKNKVKSESYATDVTRTSKPTMRAQEKLYVSDNGTSLIANLYDDNNQLVLNRNEFRDRKSCELAAQATNDPVAMQMIQNRLRNACYTVNAVYTNRTNGNTVESHMRGMIVFGRVLMVPAHLFHNLDPSNSCVLKLTSAIGVCHTAALDKCIIMDDFKDERDVIFIELPSYVNEHANMLNHFHRAEAIGKYVAEDAIMYVVSNGVSMLKTTNNLKRVTRTEYAMPDAKGHVVDTISIVEGMKYGIHALAGECGSPLVWMNPQTTGGRILGIHVAGSTNVGMCNMINVELLTKVKNRFNSVTLDVPDLDPSFTSQCVILRDEPIGLCGMVDAQLAVRQNAKTTIIPSELHGTFPITTVPAMLCKTGDIDPLSIGVHAMVSQPTIFDEDLAEKATRHLSHTLSQFRHGALEFGVLTLDQAINGDLSHKGITPLNMHTSPGYLFTHARALQKPALPGKRNFFTKISDEPLIHVPGEIVKNAVHERIESCRNDIIDFTVFVDTLKDERRTIEKAATGKTRLFNVGPMDLNIAIKMYFGAAIAYIMENSVEGEISVGLNVHGEDWKRVYDQFKRNGSNWVGGDYKCYDKTLSYQLLMKCADIFNDLYDDGPENAKIRINIFKTCFSAFHIANAQIYRVHQGNPSGIALTSIVNSMVNALMFRIVFMENGGNIESYLNHVCVKFYGDDNIGTVSEKAKHILNMRTLEQTFAKHGIEYTMPSKNSVGSTVFLDDDERTYLKRKWLPFQGRVFAPLNIESIYGMINWTRTSADLHTATQDNYLCACREMIHHGRVKFDDFVNTVKKSAQNRGIELPFVSFEESSSYWGSEDASSVITFGGQTVEFTKRSYCLDDEESYND